MAERDPGTAAQRGLVAFMVEELQPKPSHVETRPSKSAMHINSGTRVQENGSRCFRLMHYNFKYLAEIKGSLLTEGLQSSAIQSVCRQQ